MGVSMVPDMKIEPLRDLYDCCGLEMGWWLRNKATPWYNDGVPMGVFFP